MFYLHTLLPVWREKKKRAMQLSYKTSLMRYCQVWRISVTKLNETTYSIQMDKESVQESSCSRGNMAL